MTGPTPDSDPGPSATLHRKLRDYINEFLGGDDWHPDVRWKMYQVTHSLLHNFRAHGYPVGFVPDYDMLTTIHFLTGAAFGLALARGDLDTLLYDIPRPEGECEWPWSFDEWQKVAKETHEQAEKEK